MNATTTNPYEMILRLCAQAAPDPWYPRKHAQERGVDLEDVKYYLERLWLEQLLERTDGTPETGPGLLLSPEGERVLADPEMLARLREGKPLREGDRGAIVRSALSHPLRPVLTKILILANLLVFGYSLYLARQLNVMSAFLGLLPGGKRPLPDVEQRILMVLQWSGNVSPLDVLRGQWWRVMSANFVHMGALHVLMNMYCVWVVGRAMEAMWGRLRFLVIYLVAAWGGACLSLAREATILQGASGAVCGIFAAQALWLFLNARYLPGPLVRRARSGILISIILLVAISAFPGVSAWGHFGGALFGAVAALLFHWHRFAPPPWRWLALAALVPLPWLGVVAIDHAKATNVKWHQMEAEVNQEEFLKRYSGRVERILKESKDIFEDQVQPVLVSHPSRRDRNQVKELLPLVSRQQEQLNKMAALLGKIGPYRDVASEEARQVGLKALQTTAHLYELTYRSLTAGKEWKLEHDQEIDRQAKRARQLYREWQDLFN